MPIPSGNGSEVLKRAKFYALQSGSGAWTPINGETDHIYTILSVILCNRTASATTVHMYCQPDGSGQFEILGDGFANVPAQETFVWNDKFVLTGTDHLVLTNSGSHLDVWISYIEQNWDSS